MKILYYLIFITLLSLLIFVNLGNSYTPISHVQENWAWSKTEEIGMSTDARFKLNPMERLNGYKTKNGVYFFRAGKFTLDENSYSEMPLIGKGIFYIRKLEILFFIIQMMERSFGKSLIRVIRVYRITVNCSYLYREMKTRF